jgi:hypothetical protein
VLAHVCAAEQEVHLLQAAVLQVPEDCVEGEGGGGEGGDGLIGAMKTGCPSFVEYCVGKLPVIDGVGATGKEELPRAVHEMYFKGPGLTSLPIEA